MATEIERKFIVDASRWKPEGGGVRIRQGYLPMACKTVVRVRVSGEGAWLTVKGENKGMTRLEFEYPVPVSDAKAMLDGLCARPLIEKTRYSVRFSGSDWVVDVFDGENAGLVMAEIELTDENQEVIPPPWIGREVTDDPRYYNANLAIRPYGRW